MVVLQEWADKLKAETDLDFAQTIKWPAGMLELAEEMCAAGPWDKQRSREMAQSVGFCRQVALDILYPWFCSHAASHADATQDVTFLSHYKNFLAKQAFMTARCKLACRASLALKPHWEMMVGAMRMQVDHAQSGEEAQALALAVRGASLTHLLEKCILQKVGPCLSKARRAGHTSEAADLVQVLQEALRSVATQFPEAVRNALQEWQAHPMITKGNLEISVKTEELENPTIEKACGI